MVVTLVAKAAWGGGGQVGSCEGQPMYLSRQHPGLLLFQRTFPVAANCNHPHKSKAAATRPNPPTSAIRLALASPAPPTRENPTTPSAPTAVSREHQVTG